MLNDDIVRLARENTFFRKEITTGAHSQVVLMCIPRGEEIGEEIHGVDQTLVFVEGTGKAIINGEEGAVAPGHLVFVSAGARHNFVNAGNSDLKLYTIYAPPEHKPGTVHRTKSEAEKEEHDNEKQ